MFQALRERNYRLFFFGQLISLSGSWMQNVAQGWLVLRLTDSALYLGIVAAASSLPILLFSFSGGVYADRGNKQRMVIGAQVFLMCLSLILALLTLFSLIEVHYVIALAFLAGCANAFEAPARQAFIVELVGLDVLPNAIALNSSIFNGARTIGPAIAGVLVAFFGEEVAFFVNALSFLAAIIALSRIRTKKTVITPSPAPAGFTAGLRYVRNHPHIRPLLGIAVALGFFGYAYLPLLPLIARDVLHRDVVALGWLSSINGLGALIGALALLFIRREEIRERWLRATILLFPCALFMFAVCATLEQALVCVWLLGFFGISGMVLINTLIQSQVANEYRGRVMSLFTLSLMGLAPLGGMFAGIAVHVWGSVSLVQVGAAFCLTIGALCWTYKNSPLSLISTEAP